MRAAVHDRYGPPEVVSICDVPLPSIGEHDVLVRVHATTVNRTDCAYRAAYPFFVRSFTGLTRPKRRVLGTEFAGEIEAVGTSVTSLAIGDPVFGYNEGPFGAHAEYLAIAEDGPIATIPFGLSFAHAASATEGSHYALSALGGADVREGERVLVYGATGAIGSAAVQILKGLGATVTAVCATPHVEVVRALGADRVIDYLAEDFSSGSDRYDVVVDAVDKITFGACRTVLAQNGRYLSTGLGPWSQNIVFALVAPLSRGKKVLFPIPQHNHAVLQTIRGLLEAGIFSPLIDRTYPFDQIVDAYRYVETGQKVGSVVVEVIPEAEQIGT